MYKIFGNTHLIVFAPPVHKDFLLDNGAVLFKSTSALVNHIKKQPTSHNNKVLAVVSADIHRTFRQFAGHFTRVNAAGGLVYNSQKKILLIHRKGYWDLPKGKQDAGENLQTCALREVTEECGLHNLHIRSKLTHTYHYYFMHGKWQLKKTSWYAMTCKGNPALTPQREEGIDKVIWADNRQVKKALSNTFPLIYDLLNRFAVKTL